MSRKLIATKTLLYRCADIYKIIRAVVTLDEWCNIFTFIALLMVYSLELRSKKCTDNIIMHAA